MNEHILLMTVSNAEVDLDKLEANLNSAKDWLRYAPGCWLIHTKQPAETWFQRVSDSVSPKGTLVFICEVNLEDRSGKLSPAAWNWIKNVRQRTRLVAS